jgi:hypothetical protein
MRPSVSRVSWRSIRIAPTVLYTSLYLRMLSSILCDRTVRLTCSHLSCPLSLSLSLCTILSLLFIGCRGGSAIDKFLPFCFLWLSFVLLVCWFCFFFFPARSFHFCYSFHFFLDCSAKSACYVSNIVDSGGVPMSTENRALCVSAFASSVICVLWIRD